MKKFLLFAVALMATSAVAMAQDSWTVAGSNAILNGSGSWDVSNTDNDMTSTDGVNYTLVVENKTLESGVTYEYKVVKDHSWSNANYPSSNATLSVNETAVYTVTYSFSTETTAVNAVATKTGDAGEVTHIYSLAGSSSDIFGATWSETNTATEMTANQDGVYQWTSGEVECTGGFTVEYKVVVDHSWGQAYPASNATYTVADAGTYTFTFSFDPANNNAVSCEATLVTPAATAYFMKHPWGGGEWTWQELTYDEPSLAYTIVAKYGGVGVNVNTTASDNGASWFPVENITVDGNPEVGNECTFYYFAENDAVRIVKNVSSAINDVKVAVGKAYKTIENGQMIIVKDGIRYNLMGVKL